MYCVAPYILPDCSSAAKSMQPQCHLLAKTSFMEVTTSLSCNCWELTVCTHRILREQRNIHRPTTHLWSGKKDKEIHEALPRILYTFCSSAVDRNNALT